jgi:hypothetical protein
MKQFLISEVDKFANLVAITLALMCLVNEGSSTRTIKPISLDAIYQYI